MRLGGIVGVAVAMVDDDDEEADDDFLLLPPPPRRLLGWLIDRVSGWLCCERGVGTVAGPSSFLVRFLAKRFRERWRKSNASSLSRGVALQLNE